MRILTSAGAACLFVFLGPCLIANAHEPSSDLVKVFKPGQDVTSPQPLPADFSQTITSDCPVKLAGTAELSLIVAADGTPKNILFLRFIGTELDRLAVRLLSQQRFTPGTQDGAPVAVSQAVRMKLDGCLAIDTDAGGKKHVVVRLSRTPEERFSGYRDYPNEVEFTRLPDSAEANLQVNVPPGTYQRGTDISAPIAVNAPQAQFPPSSKSKRINGVCLITLIVDASGLPQHPRIIRPLAPAYDAQALDAVMHYRFKPAIKDGKEPVPVMVTVEITFRQ